MPILNKTQIQELINGNDLIRNALREQGGAPAVEAASYDLRAGIVLWKDRGSKDLEAKYFRDEAAEQAMVTLQPGQMVFVITHEELQIPANICGTVYSRNKLQRENILAVNAGHVDPGYDGPIIIRLINLGAQSWAIRLGDAVFTIVFHTVEPAKGFEPSDRRSKDQMLTSAMITASNAFSNPFHDLYRDEISRQLHEHYATVESNIRIALENEFFRRRELPLLLFEVIGGTLGGIFVLSRIPWGAVWGAAKLIFGL